MADNRKLTPVVSNKFKSIPRRCRNKIQRDLFNVRDAVRARDNGMMQLVSKCETIYRWLNDKTLEDELELSSSYEELVKRLEQNQKERQELLRRNGKTRRDRRRPLFRRDGGDDGTGVGRVISARKSLITALSPPAPPSLPTSTPYQGHEVPPSVDVSLSLSPIDQGGGGRGDVVGRRRPRASADGDDDVQYVPDDPLLLSDDDDDHHGDDDDNQGDKEEMEEAADHPEEEEECDGEGEQGGEREDEITTRRTTSARREESRRRDGSRTVIQQPSIKESSVRERAVREVSVRERSLRERSVKERTLQSMIIDGPQAGAKEPSSARDRAPTVHNSTVTSYTDSKRNSSTSMQSITANGAVPGVLADLGSSSVRRGRTRGARASESEPPAVATAASVAAERSLRSRPTHRTIATSYNGPKYLANKSMQTSVDNVASAVQADEEEEEEETPVREEAASTISRGRSTERTKDHGMKSPMQQHLVNRSMQTTVNNVESLLQADEEEEEEMPVLLHVAPTKAIRGHVKKGTRHHRMEPSTQQHVVNRSMQTTMNDVSMLLPSNSFLSVRPPARPEGRRTDRRSRSSASASVVGGETGERRRRGRGGSRTAEAAATRANGLRRDRSRARSVHSRAATTHRLTHYNGRRDGRERRERYDEFSSPSDASAASFSSADGEGACSPTLRIIVNKFARFMRAELAAELRAEGRGNLRDRRDQGRRLTLSRELIEQATRHDLCAMRDAARMPMDALIGTNLNTYQLITDYLREPERPSGGDEMRTVHVEGTKRRQPLSPDRRDVRGVRGSSPRQQGERLLDMLVEKLYGHQRVGAVGHLGDGHVQQDGGRGRDSPREERGVEDAPAHAPSRPAVTRSLARSPPGRARRLAESPDPQTPAPVARRLTDSNLKIHNVLQSVLQSDELRFDVDEVRQPLKELNQASVASTLDRTKASTDTVPISFGHLLNEIAEKKKSLSTPKNAGLKPTPANKAEDRGEQNKEPKPKKKPIFGERKIRRRKKPKRDNSSRSSTVKGSVEEPSVQSASEQPVERVESTFANHDGLTQSGSEALTPPRLSVTANPASSDTAQHTSSTKDVAGTEGTGKKRRNNESTITENKRNQRKQAAENPTPPAASSSDEIDGTPLEPSEKSAFSCDTSSTDGLRRSTRTRRPPAVLLPSYQSVIIERPNKRSKDTFKVPKAPAPRAKRRTTKNNEPRIRILRQDIIRRPDDEGRVADMEVSSSTHDVNLPEPHVTRPHLSNLESSEDAPSTEEGGKNDVSNVHFHEVIIDQVTDTRAGQLTISKDSVQHQWTKDHNLHFIVHQGESKVQFQGETNTVEAGSCFSVPKGSEYSIRNTSSCDALVLMYLASSSHVKDHGCCS